MDVTQLLEQDHRMVETLFGEYRSSASQEVLAQICDQLDVHTLLEEELVYPRLAEVDPGLAQRAAMEHDEAKQLIQQIRSGDSDGDQLARRLQSAVEAHVGEEESELFPLLRERLGDELDWMGEQVAQRRMELTSTG